MRGSVAVLLLCVVLGGCRTTGSGLFADRGYPFTDSFYDSTFSTCERSGEALPQKKPINVTKEGELSSCVKPTACNTFTFDGSESFDPDQDHLSYYWDFGDGETSEKAVVTHTYAASGMYTVTLQVRDNSGAACDSAQAVSTVTVNTPPIAVAGEDVSCCAGVETSFDAGASSDKDDDVLTYHWDFGDGESAEGAQVRHTYAQSGNYMVTLNVDDGRNTVCSTTQDTLHALVNKQPVAKITVR